MRTTVTNHSSSSSSSSNSPQLSPTRTPSSQTSLTWTSVLPLSSLLPSQVTTHCNISVERWWYLKVQQLSTHSLPCPSAFTGGTLDLLSGGLDSLLGGSGAEAAAAPATGGTPPVGGANTSSAGVCCTECVVKLWTCSHIY